MPRQISLKISRHEALRITPRPIEPDTSALYSEGEVRGMVATIEAVYESGVFRPKGPVDLDEGVEVQVVIPSGQLKPSRQLREARRIVKRIVAMPIESEDHTLGGREHDIALYGDQPPVGM